MATSYLTCPLCEATCGLEVVHTGERIESVRGDERDVFSAGYICPKGTSLGALHDDPDRLRTPMVRKGDQWRAVDWDEAFGIVAERLPPLVETHGANAVAIYVGNPAAHNLSVLLYGRALYKAIGTRSMFTATTVDQMPKHFTSGYMFGDPLSIPIPDVDRTEHLLLLGANPLVSNGSLMTAPNMRARLRAIHARGGKVVVVDPRRSRTAEVADEHHFIRPGTDALLLFALAQVLFAEDLVALDRLAEHVNGVDDVRSQCAPFTPEAVAAGHRNRGCRDQAHGTRTRSCSARGGIWPHRHYDAGIRHARQLVGRRTERAYRQPGPGRRRDVSAGRRRAVQLSTRSAQGVPARSLAQPGA